MAKGSQLKVLLPVFPTENIDPIKLSTIGDWVILQNIHSTLVELSTRNTVKPALAFKWRQSADAKKWEFFFDKNLKWSDGSELKIEQILKSLQRAISVTSHTRLQEYIGEISSDQQQNSIIFTLNKVAPNFLVSLALADLSILHPQAYSKNVFTWSVPASGPFTVYEYKNGEIKLIRNPYYWNNSEQDFNGVTYIKGFHKKEDLKKFNEENFDAGQLDPGLIIDVSELSDLKNNYNIFSSNYDMNITLNFLKKELNRVNLDW